MVAVDCVSLRAPNSNHVLSVDAKKFKHLFKTVHKWHITIENHAITAHDGSHKRLACEKKTVIAQSAVGHQPGAQFNYYKVLKTLQSKLPDEHSRAHCATHCHHQWHGRDAILLHQALKQSL